MNSEKDLNNHFSRSEIVKLTIRPVLVGTFPVFKSFSGAHSVNPGIYCTILSQDLFFRDHHLLGTMFFSFNEPPRFTTSKIRYT